MSKCFCGLFKSVRAPTCKRCLKKKKGIDNLTKREVPCEFSGGIRNETGHLHVVNWSASSCVNDYNVLSKEATRTRSDAVVVDTNTLCREGQVATPFKQQDDTGLGAVGSKKRKGRPNEECSFIDESCCTLESEFIPSDSSLSDGEMCFFSVESEADVVGFSEIDVDSDGEESDNGFLTDDASDTSVDSSKDSAKEADEVPEGKGDCVGVGGKHAVPHITYVSKVKALSNDSCMNCRRCSTNGFDGLECYKVELSTCCLDDVRFSVKRWRTFAKKECNSEGVLLCFQCHEVLSKSRYELRNKREVTWKDLWPVYTWLFITSSEALRRHGCGILQVIPKQWYGYWVGSLHSLHMEFFPSGSLQYYESTVDGKVVDVTMKRSVFDQMNGGLKLGVIMEVCNELLVPVCLCPWGCTCYYYEKGSCSIDAVLNQEFGYVESTGVVCEGGAKQKVASMRDDFFGHVDCHLFNPEWAVYPSVYYLKNHGPVFLTCSEHDGGTTDQYFHLPKTKSCLPSRVSESLSPSVLRTRTLRASRPMKYSNSYRLQKCQASYCGIDTAYISEDRKFDYLSHVEDISEARSFAFREDIKSLANDLYKRGEISEEYFENLKARSDQLFGNCSLQDSDGDVYGDGGTLLCLPDAIKLQQLLCGSGVMQVRSALTGQSSSYRPNWPSIVLRVQKNNRFGCSFPLLPMMKSVTIQGQKSACYLSLWCLCMGFVCISEVWESAASGVEVSSDWKGFLLSYLSRSVTKQSIALSKHTNPFYVPKSADLMKPCGLNTVIFGTKDPVFPLQLESALRNCFTGGEFCSVEIDAGDMSLEEFKSTIADNIQEDCVVMLITRTCPCIRWELPELMNVSGHKLELRLVNFVKTPGDSGRPNQWKAETWCRHGNMFDLWWLHKRDFVSTRSFRAGQLTCDTRMFTFAVFVVMKDVSMCEYRRSYLKYIGGQDHVMCRVHHIPLITSHISREKQRKKDYLTCACLVHGSLCGRKEEYQCPVDKCDCCICKTCFKLLGKESVNFVEAGVSAGRQGPINSDEEYESGDEADVNSICSKELEDYAETSSTSSVESSEAIDYSGLHTGSDVPMFDIEHGAEGPTDQAFSDGDDTYEGIIPTTHSGNEPLHYTGAVASMGTSVLLNKFGTVLVRKDNRLQATKRERNLVERVASRVCGSTIPLVYMEAMLFPSIFWCQNGHSSGGIVGSIPTSLFCQHSTRRRFRIASLADHAKVRLKGCASVAHTSPSYLSFLFDTLANGALEGTDTRVVLSRGFEESMGPAGMRVRNRDQDFYTDTIDNRQNCHNLCASERHKRNTLFVTLTCNQREHFGVSAIKRYVDSDVALENYKKHHANMFPREKRLSVNEETEVRFALQEAARPLIVRNWMEVRRLLIRYLLHSEEYPTGKIAKIFVRDEYQGESGNLSHLHMLLSLCDDYSTEAGRDLIQRIIRGFVDEIVGLDEVQEFIDEGILKSWPDYWEMKEQAHRILPHSCDSHRCLRRTGPGRDQLKCRVPDPRILSNDLLSFYERKIEVQHSNEALSLYEQLGFCEDRFKNGGSFVPTVDFLDPKRIFAPARFGEGNITPVLGRLFAATRSSMNAQICTSFGTSRYLVKYVSLMDENNYVAMSPSTNNESTWKVEQNALHNTKITSSAINEKLKLQRSRNKDKPRGRAIASTEMMQIILGYPQVHTNVEYIKVTSLPMGDRPGLERKSPAERYKEFINKTEFGAEGPPDIYTYCCPMLHKRQEKFIDSDVSRCFTTSQEIMLRDQVHCPVTLDRVTIFGLRPPELLVIDKMEWYFRYFERSKSPYVNEKEVLLKFCSLVKTDIYSSTWIDGLGYRIRLRPKAIPELGNILTTVTAENGQSTPRSVELLCWISSCFVLDGLTINSQTELGHVATALPRIESKRWLRAQENYIAHELANDQLPIVVFSNVRPKNATKFITHLLLSMGRFETERDMWCLPSLREAFAYCKLLDVERAVDITEESCLYMLKTWVVDQCQYYPITSKTMDNFVCSAESILRSALMNDQIPVDEMPACLYTKLVQDINDDILKEHYGLRASLVLATLNGLQSAYSLCPELLPDFDSVMKADRNPISEQVRFPKHPSQSQLSYQEQTRVFDMCKNTVNRYCEPSTVAPKNVIIAGPPGAGKTHCLLQAVLYTLCLGKTAITTAVLAERAFLLGGKHFHKLFCLRVRERGFRVNRMAELAVISLQKNVCSLSFLRKLDVLFVDEMGQLSAEMLSVLDIIMRRIRNSSVFMGGILVIGTLDQIQLRPIKQLPFLLSPYVLTSFTLDRLEHYVRCSGCRVLQKMNKLARYYTQDKNLLEAAIDEFVDLAEKNCTFLAGWDDLRGAQDVLRIFPKRKQAAEATRSFLDRKKQEVTSRGRRFLTSTAVDSMVPLESHGEWSVASELISGYLDRSAGEPRTLAFFKGAIYQFTFNYPKRFSNTQLCILLEVPSQEHIQSFKPVTVYAAPAGSKMADIQGLTGEQLLAQGWKEVKVGTAPEYSQTIWNHGVKAKRKQYGLRHHVATTVHSAIGHTVLKVATELSLQNGVWERAMVVVLISRVKRARDIIFIGDKAQNLLALRRGLLIRCQYDEYMNHLVDVMAGIAQQTDLRYISVRVHPYRPKDIPLPLDNSGVVYLIQSIPDTNALYVGYTQNLRTRLNQHNSGYGSKTTCDPSLRPWALAAYVCGFEGNRPLMNRFEVAWQYKNQQVQPRCVQESIDLARELAAGHFLQHKLLVVDQIS